MRFVTIVLILLLFFVSAEAISGQIHVETSIPDFNSHSWLTDTDRFHIFDDNSMPYRLIRLSVDGNVAIMGISIVALDSLDVTSRYQQPKTFTGIRTDGRNATENSTDTIADVRVLSRVSDGYRTVFEIAVRVFRQKSYGKIWLINQFQLEYDITSAYTSGRINAVPNGLIDRIIAEPTQKLHSNTQSLSASEIGEDGYIIITSDELTTVFEPLARWKCQLGYDASVVSTDSIYGACAGIDQQEQIREFLTDAWNNGVRWVLLGGDECIVPVRYAYHLNRSVEVAIEKQQICDLYYADLTGDWDSDGDGLYGEPTSDSPDIIPELNIGRAVVRDSAGAAHFVEKTIRYERMEIDDPDGFASSVLMASSDQMRDYGTGGQDSIIAAGLPEHLDIDIESLAESPTGDDPSPDNPDADDFVSKLSEGQNLFYILAHGQVDGITSRAANYNEWPKSMVFTRDEAPSGHGTLDDLTNFGRFGIVYSIGCNNGAFDMDTLPYEYEYPSIAEKMLTDSLRGAAAMIAYSRWGWVASSYYLTLDFNDYLFNTDNRIGLANDYSKLSNSYIRDLVYGLNVYGDPSLRVWTVEPSPLSVVGLPDHVDLGDNYITAQILSDGQPIEETLVTVVSDSGIIFSTLSDDSGNINLDFFFGPDTTITITASRTGYIPSVTTLEPVIALDADDDDDDILPREFALHQNYPNPFNPQTTVTFVLPERASARLTVYNILGQTVASVLDEELVAGSHSVEIDGAGWPSGVYLYRFETDQYSETRKMLLLK